MKTPTDSDKRSTMFCRPNRAMAVAVFQTFAESFPRVHLAVSSPDFNRVELPLKCFGESGPFDLICHSQNAIIRMRCCDARLLQLETTFEAQLSVVLSDPPVHRKRRT